MALMEPVENPPDPRHLRGAGGDYYTADLVVSLEHLDLVGAELTGLLGKDSHVLVEKSDLLDLALIRLTDDAGTAAAAATVIGRLPPLYRVEALFGRTHLDRLLRALRFYFKHKYAGWTPTLAKNRLMGNVVGGGRISHGGDQPPQALRADPRPPRRSGPEGSGVRVAVIDTAMSNNDWLTGGWTASPGDVLDEGVENPPVAGHATFVTGLVLHQAPSCQVLVRRVLDEKGRASSWELANAIAEVGRTRPDVINLSVVCFTADGEPPELLTTAIDRLPPETVVVAAAGNHGDWEPDGEHDDAEEDEVPADQMPVRSSPTSQQDEVPAALSDEAEEGQEDQEGQEGRDAGNASDEGKDQEAGKGAADPEAAEVERQRRAPAFPAAQGRVKAVAAADEDGRLAAFNPEGAPWVDVVSLGVGVVSTYLGDQWARWSGSSFAAALVSGAIAAGTVPGRVPAPEAWAALAKDMIDLPNDPGAEPATVGGPAVVKAPRPKWLRLDDPAQRQQKLAAD